MAQTLEQLKRLTQSTRDLLSVVTTMKTIAAVNIRQYEQAVASLLLYNQNVEQALTAVLRDRADIFIAGRKAAPGRLGAVVFGSDQGMCGPINDSIAHFALEDIKEAAPDKTQTPAILAVGERVAYRLMDEGADVEDIVHLPESVSGITGKVMEVLYFVEQWGSNKGIAHIHLYYNRPEGGAGSEPIRVVLLPLDNSWLLKVKKRSWPTKSIPLYTQNWDTLFSHLVRQYLFVSIYRAFAESLASENAARLRSMQNAQKNIEQQLVNLTANYNQRRQMAITEELLDIVSGFKTLERKKNQAKVGKNRKLG
ncbi:MAG: F0F1 ATP synthase subunit gamma [Desulfatibacillaceae bacterium]|nr:F0F1 ATP synthase subunit gamma [Desulfatibacillaceae bacterium]